MDKKCITINHIIIKTVGIKSLVVAMQIEVVRMTYDVDYGNPEVHATLIKCKL